MNCETQQSLKLNEIQGALHSIFSKLVKVEEKGSKYIKVIEAQAGELTEIRKDQENLYRCMQSFNSSITSILEHMMGLQANINQLLKQHKHVKGKNVTAKDSTDK